MPSLFLITAAALTSVVGAQTVAPLWAQCGGLGFTGPTACAAGAYCLYYNQYFSQCMPVLSTSTTLATSTRPATSSSSSSSSKSSTKSSSSSSNAALTTYTKTTTTISSSKTSVASTKTSTSVTPAVTGYQYLLSFGDSYSQTGFDVTQAAANPASASNLLSNPPFPGWTTSGGSNWIDFAIAKYNHSLILNYNLAYGGATTDAALVTPYASTVLSFVDQVTEFSTYMASKPAWVPWTANNALFAVWMGVNDVGNAWYLSNWSTLASTIIDRYISQVQILYNAGARKFVFLSVPPIQRTPAVIAGGSADSIAQEAAAIVYYNQLLSTAVANFKANNAGTTAWVFDTTSSFNTVLDNPTAYGAPNNTCYNGDGVSCLWFNDYHPGQAIHNLVAKGVAALTGM